jgi:hypothetical protein
MKKLLISLFTFFHLASWAQSPIEVLQSTIKIPAFGEEEFYLGFAEGDRVIFDFEEEGKKELKELLVFEWPNNLKYSDFKVSRIDNKIFDIHHTSIYKFRLVNSAIGGRVCKIRIQRIPLTNTKDFDTNVYWRTTSDTAYIPTAEKYLTKTDTIITHIIDQIAKVSSQNALNGNSNLSIVDIDLPEGTTAWSYFIGVGQEGQKVFNDATDKLLTRTEQVVSKIEGYGAMAALAIYGLNLFAQAQGSDNVKYWLIPDWNNVMLFQSRQQFQTYKVGDVVNDASKMIHPVVGRVYLGLMNDNILEPIEVIIKVTAFRVIQSWSTRIVQKQVITQRTEPFLK